MSFECGCFCVCAVSSFFFVYVFFRCCFSVGVFCLLLLLLWHVFIFKYASCCFDQVLLFIFSFASCLLFIDIHVVSRASPRVKDMRTATPLTTCSLWECGEYADGNTQHRLREAGRAAGLGAVTELHRSCTTLCCSWTIDKPHYAGPHLPLFRSLSVLYLGPRRVIGSA